MDFKLFKKVVDEGSENGLYSIKLNYLGEPLMNKNLPKMVEYAKAADDGDFQYWSTAKIQFDINKNWVGYLVNTNLEVQLRYDTRNRWVGLIV